MKLDAQLLSTLAVVGFFVGAPFSTLITPSSVDPSPRRGILGCGGGAAGAGAPIAGLTKTELAVSSLARRFREEERCPTARTGR